VRPEQDPKRTSFRGTVVGGSRERDHHLSGSEGHVPVRSRADARGEQRQAIRFRGHHRALAGEHESGRSERERRRALERQHSRSAGTEEQGVGTV